MGLKILTVYIGSEKYTRYLFLAIKIFHLRKMTTLILSIISKDRNADSDLFMLYIDFAGTGAFLPVR